MSRDPTAYPAVLERHGRFVVARPLFDRPAAGGRTPAVDPARAKAKIGDLVLVAIKPSRRGGRAEIVRRLGRPDIAADVIEALMIDRGLDRSFDEAVVAANSVSYCLSSSIFTRDVNRAFRAMRDLQAGITYINAGTTGAEVHLPFGGTKDTGNGHREAGQAALDVFTEWKSIYVDYSGRLQRAQIDNA